MPRTYLGKPVHELKCDEPFFTAVATRRKTAELRYNDRNYKVGDFLLLRKGNQEVVRMISHCVYDRDFMAGIIPGYCLLSLAVIGTYEEDRLIEAINKQPLINEDVQSESYNNRRSVDAVNTPAIIRDGVVRRNRTIG
jgi:hypothetical protein